MNSVQKQLYSWKEFDRDIEVLGQKITDSKLKINLIYGIPRGGLIVAVVLSYKLGIPLTFAPELIDEQTLVVDDICDTGKTYDQLCERIGKRPVFAALHYNPEHDLAAPDFWVNKKTAWVVYPWETEESSKYDGTSDNQ